MTEVVHGCLQSLYLLRHLKDSMLTASSITAPTDSDSLQTNQPDESNTGKYVATCIRLCARCEKFQYVQYLLATKGLLTAQYEVTLRQLQGVLQEALTYIKSMMQRVLDSDVTTVKFRLTHAKDVAKITLQLLEMEASLLMASARKERDFDEERQQHKAEDLEDFMEFFAWSLTALLLEMELYFDDLLRHSTSPATNMETGTSHDDVLEFNREAFDEQMLQLHQHVHSSKQVLAQVMVFFQHDELSHDEQEHIDVQTIQLHYKINAFHRTFYIRHQMVPSAIYSTPALIRSLLLNDLTLTPLQQMERDLVLDALVNPASTLDIEAKELGKRSKEPMWLKGSFGQQAVSILKLPPHLAAAPQLSSAGNSPNHHAASPAGIAWKPYEDELLILNFLHASGPSVKEIVTSFGYFVDRGSLHVLYSDHGDFGSLQDMFQHCRNDIQLPAAFPMVLSLFWMKDLLSALVHLQAMKIKHNFLLPQNVIVCPKMCLKIRNFQAATAYLPKQEVSIKAPSIPAARRKSPRVEALQYAISSFNPDLAVYTKDGPSDIYAFAMLGLSILCMEDVSQLGQEVQRIQHTVQNLQDDQLIDRELLADLLLDAVKTEIEGLPPTSRPTAAALMLRLQDVIDLQGGDARLLKKSREYKAIKSFEAALQLSVATKTGESPPNTNSIQVQEPLQSQFGRGERSPKEVNISVTNANQAAIKPAQASPPVSRKETAPSLQTLEVEGTYASHAIAGEEEEYEEGSETDEGSIPLESLTSIECLSLLNHIGCSSILSTKDLSGEKLLHIASIADLVTLGISLPSGVRASKVMEQLQALQLAGRVPIAVLAADPLSSLEDKPPQKQVPGGVASPQQPASPSSVNGTSLRILPEGVYEGSLVNGMRDGFGIMRYHTGDVYEGQWMLDVRQGEGAMLYSNGDRFEGVWDKGRFRGEGNYNFRV